MRTKSHIKLIAWLWLLFPVFVLSQDISREIKGPSYYLNFPSELLHYEGDDPLQLISYTDVDRQLQLNLNASEDLILTSYEHSSLNGEPQYFGIDKEEITPFNWLWIQLSVITEESQLVELKLRRPKSWLKKHGLVEIGDKSNVDLSDLGIKGSAEILGIFPNTFDSRFQEHDSESNQRYRPIIGVSKRFGQEINRYIFTNGEVLKATPGHIIWSLTHNRWMAISSLEIGEKVELADGSTTQLKEGGSNFENTTVYSIEVYRDHNFYVGESGILVHNDCVGAVLRRLAKGSDDIIKKMNQKLVKSGAMREFMDADGVLTEFGKRFKNMRNINKDLLIKDILDKPKLAKIFRESPELLDSWKDLAKIGPRSRKGIPQGHDLRLNAQFLKKYADLPPLKRVKLKTFLDRQKAAESFTGKVNYTSKSKNINGKDISIRYDRYGFPDFMEYVPKPFKKFIVKSDNLQGSLNKAADFRLANRELAKRLKIKGPYTRGEKFATKSYRWTSPSQNFELKEGGKWVKYTWHHHQDGKTLIPIKSKVHSPGEGGFTHSGGDSLIRDGLKGIFPSPNF